MPSLAKEVSERVTASELGVGDRTFGQIPSDGGSGGRARGVGGDGARVRKQRDTTSRYSAGAFAAMEASLRGWGTDDGVT